MLLQNSFEGGTNNSSITTGNSGGTSGDAFSLVDTDGGSPVFTNAQAAHGTLSARLPPDSGLQWGLSGNGDRYIRAYLRPVLHNTSGQTHTIRLELATPNVGAFWYAEIALTSTTATLTLQAWNNSGGEQVIVGTASTAPLTGQWIRVELRATNAASGNGELRLYNSPDSSTPSATITGNMTQTLEAWSYAQVYHYASVAGTGPDIWVDDLALSDTGWPGPAVASAVDKTGTDTGTLTGQAGVTAVPSRSDTGALTEQTKVGLTRADQVTLAEQAAAAPALTRADTAALTDQASVGVAHGRADQAALTEQATIAVAHARTDGGTLTEGPLTVALTATDTATLGELSDIDELFGPAVADLGTVGDQARIAAALPLTDAGAVADQAAVHVLRFGADTAALAETSLIGLPATDSGVLTETGTVTALLTASDTVLLDELAQAVQPVAASDSALLEELATVITLGGDITRASPPYTGWAASTPYT
ncbi:hypothetical protein [Microbispora rosea]|uniref:hypothetical protein n=1 Tax=Microbispora rosea TaxID=58117 RepID=UPI0037AC398F